MRTRGVWDELPGFMLRLEATAADGSQATTCARFDADLDHYAEADRLLGAFASTAGDKQF